MSTHSTRDSRDQPQELAIYTDHPIGDRCTWKIDVTAKYFVRVGSVEQVRSLIGRSEYQSSSKVCIVGEGANTLFAERHYDGMVIEVAMKGVEKIREEGRYSYWHIGAGEDWVELVRHTVLDMNLAGLENLAFIPGRVGSAPIQNIGAYGGSFEDVCDSVEYIDMGTGEIVTVAGEHCGFTYRSSNFKQMIADQQRRFIITAVVLRLSVPDHHSVHSEYYSNYESLAGELHDQGVTRPTIQDIYRAVVSLRQKKLPDWQQIGTNGSLFMNPIVRGEQVRELLQKYPKLQYYPVEKMKYVKSTEYKVQSTGRYKVAAGHIFDELGWRGRRVGQVGTWDRHALVLCNYGTKDPADIIKVIRMMQDDFEKATGIRLEPEINIVY